MSQNQHGDRLLPPVPVVVPGGSAPAWHNGLHRDPLPSSCTPKIWCTGLLLLVLGVLAEGLAALGYCIVQDGVTQCTSNYRTLSVGTLDPTSEVMVIDGSGQVPETQSLSSPPEPWWKFQTTFSCKSSSCGTIAAYGMEEYLTTADGSQYGGWHLSYVYNQVRLSSGGTDLVVPVSASNSNMAVTIEADYSTNKISFHVVDADTTTCLLPNAADDCIYTTDGSLDLNDFDRDKPNYKMAIGGLSGPSDVFTGRITQALQTVQVGAEYIMIFAYLFVGTLCYCALYITGQWIVASESAELGEEEKIGNIEQKEFVAQQLANAPKTADPEWNEKLHKWKASQDLYKEVVEADDGLKNLRVYGLRAMFFCIVVLDMFVVLNMAAPGGKGFYNQSTSFTDAFFKAWNFANGGVGWVFLFSSLLETVLFVIGCACVVWPAGKVQQKHQQPNRFQGASAENLDRRVTSVNEETDSTCLLIACHNSALNDGMRTDLVRTLERALDNFPPEAIFVCDNGRGAHPSDNTEGLCNEICNKRFGLEANRKINYVFIPEGNKTHALYWVSEWWIPYLVQQDKIPNFKNLIMIDDDVPLPSNFDFQASQMDRDPTLACIGYAITAVTPTDPGTGESEYNFLVSMQDVEYRLSGFFKLFQAQLGGSAFYAHGAVSLWNRELLGKEILYKHDTEFHGEDLYMGLLLHRQSKGMKIDFSASDVVETFAPDHFKLLFKQRTKSWDLATHRKFPSILRELTCRWTNQFLLLKVFHFGEVVAVIQDWLRLYLFILLLLTNPMCLAGITAFFFALAYIQLLLFRCLVLRRRPDLKDKLGPLALFAFPVYKTVSTFMFRQYAMMENAFNYSGNFKRHTVEKRQTWARDEELLEKVRAKQGAAKTTLLMENNNFPPRPDMNPNWWHVWQPQGNLDPEFGYWKDGVFSVPGTEDDQQSQRKLRQSQQVGCISFVPKQVTDRIHQMTEGATAEIFAYHADNQGRLAPLLLAHVTLMRLGEECNQSCFRQETIAKSSVAMLRSEIYNEILSKVKIAPFDSSGGHVQMVKTDIRKYQEKIDELDKIWRNAITQSMAQNIPKGDPGYARYLFMTREISEMVNNEDLPGHSWEQDLVQGIIFVLDRIIETIASMRIPDAHDKFRSAKKTIHDCKRELETGKLMR